MNSTASGLNRAVSRSAGSGKTGMTGIDGTDALDGTTSTGLSSRDDAGEATADGAGEGRKAPRHRPSRDEWSHAIDHLMNLPSGPPTDAEFADLAHELGVSVRAVRGRYLEAIRKAIRTGAQVPHPNQLAAGALAAPSLRIAGSAMADEIGPLALWALEVALRRTPGRAALGLLARERRRRASEGDRSAGDPNRRTAPERSRRGASHLDSPRPPPLETTRQHPSSTSTQKDPTMSTFDPRDLHDAITALSNRRARETARAGRPTVADHSSDPIDGEASASDTQASVAVLSGPARWPRDGRIVRPWVTTAVDGYSGMRMCSLVHFEPPSQVTECEVIRMCLELRGRLPDVLIVHRKADDRDLGDAA